MNIILLADNEYIIYTKCDIDYAKVIHELKFSTSNI